MIRYRPYNIYISASFKAMQIFSSIDDLKQFIADEQTRISRFVGQNYSLITKDADFIKPMLYRRTEAPAGIGYEYALFEKCAPNARNNPRPTLNRAFLQTQIQAFKDLPCEKYPGIEVNYRQDIARTDAAYVYESLKTLRESDRRRTLNPDSGKLPRERPEDTEKDPIQTEDAQAGRMSGMMRKRKTGEHRSANGSSSRLPPL